MAWRRQVALSGVRAPDRWPTIAVWSVSQLSRLVFSGAPVGARAALAHRHGVRPAVGAWTTVLETVWTISISPFVVFATLPAWGQHVEGWRVLSIVALAPGALLLWVVARPVRALTWIAHVLRRVPGLRRLVPDDIETLAVDLRPREALGLLGRYLLNYLLRTLAFVVLLGGMTHLSPGLVFTAVGAHALGRLVGALALFAPGGIGPREGATALVLAPLIGSAALILVAAARLAELVAEALLLLVSRVVAGTADGRRAEEHVP
jgi:hypothetical protein